MSFSHSLLSKLHSSFSFHFSLFRSQSHILSIFLCVILSLMFILILFWSFYLQYFFLSPSPLSLCFSQFSLTLSLSPVILWFCLSVPHSTNLHPLFPSFIFPLYFSPSFPRSFSRRLSFFFLHHPHPSLIYSLLPSFSPIPSFSLSYTFCLGLTQAPSFILLIHPLPFYLSLSFLLCFLSHLLIFFPHSIHITHLFN